MSKEVLARLKYMINEHYINEAEIMSEMYESDLDKKEMGELRDFMNNHPYAKVSELIHKTRAELKKPHTS